MVNYMNEQMDLRLLLLYYIVTISIFLIEEVKTYNIC